MSEKSPYPYDTHLNVLYPPLEVVDVPVAEAAIDAVIGRAVDLHFHAVEFEVFRLRPRYDRLARFDNEYRN